MRELPLTKGKTARVDDADYARLSRRKWTYLANGRSGYAVRWETRNGKTYTIYMHRQIMGAETGQQVDHVDGDGLNNQRHNLRLCGVSHNLANRAAPVRTIPYRGVYAETRGRRLPYFAAIKAFRRSWHLGAFTDQAAAARAYDAASLYFFGSFARLNFPDDVATTQALPLPPVIARLVAADTQLTLDLETDLDAVPLTPARADWYEFAQLRRWRAVGAETAQRTDDWDDGLL